jgi:putative serine protease PepD
MSVQPPYPPPSAQPPHPFGNTEQLPVAPPPRRRPSRGAFAASVLTAALVVGGAAGVGGAAAFTAFDNEDGGSSSNNGGTPTASQVMDTPDSPAADGSVEQVADSVLPSVVKLDVEGNEGAGSGSGIILDSDGLILTNNHVAEIAGDGGQVTVSFHDGSKASAEVVGTDPLTDTALVQAQDVSDLTPATIGKSANLGVGENVVAIGSPYGLDATVTSGIVSALDRPVAVGADAEGNSTTYPAIQTDAAINPGNSGGPLVDMKGRVVGINASIRTVPGGDEGSIGLGFAIPIDEVLPIIDQMKNGETPTHARLGITVSDVANAQGAEVVDGAEIQEITNGSAAEDAGLQKGDVITKIDDHLVSGSDSLVATVRSYRPGDEVEVTYERDGDSGTATLTLGTDADTSGS